MKYTFFFSLAAATILLGAGCKPAEQIAYQEIQYAPPTTVVGAADPRTEQVYSYCEKNGNRLLVQFDQKTQKPQTYCVFSNNTQCDAFAFFDGTCGPQEGARLYTNTSADMSELLRGCSETDPVVCGANGQNYTNRCAALIQKITIAHDGSCTKKEQEAAMPTTDAAAEQQVASEVVINEEDKTTPTTDLPTKAPEATWIPLLQQIVRSTAKTTPATTIDSCVIDGEYYYLLSAPLAVLYNADGEVSCFPKNDMTGECPENFAPQTQCTRLWTDKR